MRRSDWESMTTELGRRGRGSRESGAFLLGDRGRDRRTVTRVVYFDDLDSTCLTGDIQLEGLAYSKLWDICDAEKRLVIGDVHTHPGSRVQQSSVDAANPMIAQDGHVALILPDLAMHQINAREVGIHRYDGHGWQTWSGKDAARRLLIRRSV
jgi:proteasome lid subunit RPN8/RPN11